MDIMSILAAIVPGILGGNIAGALLKKHSLGVLGNSLSGILGGGLGGTLGGSALGGALGSAMLGNVASGGIGGTVVMIVVGMIKKAMAKA